MLTTFGQLTYSNEIVFQGFIDGMIYALVALGLVLIYRATGVINFAQGAIGAFASVIRNLDRLAARRAAVRYAVVDRMIHHDDGPMHWYCNETGCGNQNFYWYEETEANMLRLIPWDLDGAFENNTNPSPYTDIADGWGEITANCEPFAYGDLDLLQRSAACDPLIGTLTTYSAEYDALHAELLAGPFSPERVDEQLDTWIAQIEPAVAEAVALHDDAVTIEEWQAAVDEFRRGLEISRTS